MRLLGIDPGWTTGVATFIDGKYNTFTLPTKTTQGREILYLFIRDGDWDVVCCEGFSTPGLIHAAGIDTLELIGAVQALCWLLAITCKIQYPVQRRPCLPEAERILKQVLHKKHYPPHEQDALSHVVLYMRNFIKEHKRAVQ